MTVRQRFQLHYHAARLFAEAFADAGLPVSRLHSYRAKFDKTVRGQWFRVLVEEGSHVPALGLARNWCEEMAQARSVAIAHLDTTLADMAKNLSHGPAQ